MTRIEMSAGPGQYEHDRADALTKTKSVHVTMGTSPSRPSTFAKEGMMDVAPGQYDDGMRFNSNVKSFKIGEKRTEKARESMGPGAYSPERADAMTRSRSANINMGTTPSRPSTFAKEGMMDVAPGQYNHETRFGEETKSFRIGEKRETRIEMTAGPGQYSPERGDAMTKTKMVNINMGTSQSRTQTFAKGGDMEVAPG